MYTKEYSYIGTVRYVFNPRAKRVILKVKPDASVWVTLPPFFELHKAEAFLLERSAWVQNAQNKMRKKSIAQQFLENGAFTHFHTIEFFTQDVSDVSAKIHKTSVHIILPTTISRESPECQSVVRELYVQVLQKEAREYLPQRVKELAHNHGFIYTSVRITSAKTRWGSCSAKNAINFTWYIMKLPLHLIDFIILHELCHTVHKNHGEKFHALLDKCTAGKAKAYSKELRTFSIL